MAHFARCGLWITHRVRKVKRGRRKSVKARPEALRRASFGTAKVTFQ